MTDKERIERLERTLYDLIDAFQRFNSDHTWQAWNDPLTAFKEEIEKEDMGAEKERGE